jgi:CubicO group peptidase (beta-lactamase class C family)
MYMLTADFTAFTMVAAMFEKITGVSWKEMVAKTLTEDLGLDVHIGWPNGLAFDQPWGHIITRKKTEAFPPDHPSIK